MNMLEELKRYNYIGSVDGLIFLLDVICGKELINLREISNRCALRPDLNINYLGALAFFKYLDLIQYSNEIIRLTTSGEEFLKVYKVNRIDHLSRLCIIKLFNENVFDEKSFVFNDRNGNIIIKRHVFSLTLASIRNFLITNNVITRNNMGDFNISSKFEDFFTKEIFAQTNSKTLEELLEQKMRQQEQGLKAEEFVLNFEKNRLKSHPFVNMVKRISDFDVAAGYDIVSFTTDTDVYYNRFIEVKSYRGFKQFFWSENELDIAKFKGDQYFLCLVNMDKILDKDYEPEFIQAPANKIFTDNEWMVTSSLYRISSTST